MSVILCRTCGRELVLSPGVELVCCPACSTNNCSPQAEADVADVLNRATGQRLRCDFIHAEASYQYALNISPEEPEALWGLVQCRYGVEYVNDPRTGRPMPIVHAVRKRPMLTDPDFREACELAPEAVREQYRREAEYIDGTMAKIRQLAQAGEKYDIFLCHKTSRTDGAEGYTEDCMRATEIYMELGKLGYRVFFAPFSGLNPGENYEAGIYHALCTSRLMFVICSNANHITSPWVRTEWQRFLEMSYEDDADKRLIPLLYDSFPPRRLPDDFRQLQAINMGGLNARETLLKAVKTICGSRTPSVPQDPGHAPESDFTIGMVKGGVSIIKYNGPGGMVRIPSTIDGQKVVMIGDNAFEEHTGLAEVVIPEGVTSIGESAFEACGSLTSLSLPASLNSIGFAAFAKCRALRAIAVPAENRAFYVQDNVLFSRKNVLIRYPAGLAAAAYAIPAGVTCIGNMAFDACDHLQSVTIPQSVTTIRNWAFKSSASLTSIVIPGSVTSIGEWAFSECSGLTHVTLPEGLKSIGEDAFEHCTGLTSLTIPRNTIIEGMAFDYCDDLVLRVHPGSPAQKHAQEYGMPFELIGPACAPESDFATVAEEGGVAIVRYTGPGGEVLIPPAIGGQKVLRIGEKAFEEHAGLTKVVIPEGVTSIGDAAFDSCNSLTSVSIPQSVTSIENTPFHGCNALHTITVAAGNPSYYAQNNVLFSQDHSLIRYPAGLAATSYIIPEGVTNIRHHAFSGCTSLTSVSIPESVASIKDYAFWGCTGLTGVNIPKGVTSIGGDAFKGCPDLVLRVHPYSPAHKYAQQANLRFELTGPVYAPERHFDTDAAKGGVAIIKYTGPGGEVLIPPTINGQKVVEIGENAFEEHRKLKEVVIPEGVTTIGYSAFRGSSLTSVAIPASVTTIDGNPFSHCRSLQAITVAEGNPAYYAQDNVLFSRKNVLIRYPAGLAAAAYAIPAGVTAIGDYAFDACARLQSVTIPDSVTVIGDWAFDGCTRLNSIVIPPSVTAIGEYAFSDCTRLSSVTIPGSATRIGDMAFESSDDLTLHMPFGAPAHRYAEENRIPFELIGPAHSPVNHFTTSAAAGGVAISGYTGPGGEVVVPAAIGGQKVVEIGKKAFQKQEKLTSIILPDGVSRIGDWAFSGCTGLKSITIPDSVRSIGQFAFQFCCSLTALAIPEGVTSIGVWAFFGCNSMTSVTLPGSVASIGDAAFECCTSLTLRFLPDTFAHRYAQENGLRFELLSSAPTPESHFETRATEGGVAIARYTGSGSEVLIPATLHGKKVVEIGEGAFEEQTQLTKVIIPEGVTRIEGHAFLGCKSLQSVTLPEGVTSIGSWVFKDCTSLRGIDLPGTVARISYGAFEGCTSLEGIDLPDSVTTLDGWTFKGCTGLTRVKLPNRLTHIPQTMFGDCTSLEGINLPDSVTNIGTQAFKGCTGMTSIFIPKSVLDIGDDAFEGCTSLTFRVYPVCPAHRYAKKFRFPLELLGSTPAKSAKPAPQIACAPERDFETQVVPGGVAITGYTGPGGEVRIPAAIMRQKVVEIGQKAFFERTDLTKVIIPPGVTCIGTSAFDSCPGLTSVSIPQGVTSIGAFAFNCCPALTNVNIPEGVTSIGDGAFGVCTGLTSVSIPQSVTSIGNYTFIGCTGLTSVSIPQGVTSIGTSAFDSCANLTLRVHPNAPAHRYAQEKSIRFELIGGASQPAKPAPQIACAPERDFETQVVQGGVAITGYTGPGGEVRIPAAIMRQKVVEIGQKAFFEHTDLTKVIIPPGVTCIGAFAFSCCPVLTDVNIPEGVTSIGDGAFGVCTSLTSVSVPQSVTSIGDFSFIGCTDLTLRVHPDTIAHRYAQEKSIRFELIGGASQPAPAPAKPAPQPARAPESHFTTASTPAGLTITRYTGNAARVVIPAMIAGQRVAEIGVDAFRANLALAEVVIPEGLQRIGYSAFRECSNLQRVTLPESLADIDGNAFQGCRHLQRITLPKGLTKINNYTFNGCTSLKAVILPEKVVSIGESAFDYCTALTSVTLPAGLREIGNMAFYRCFELSGINLPANVRLGKDVFGQCKKLPASITRRSATSFAGFVDKILPF